MGLDTKLNLNDNLVEQQLNDILSLSGETTIYNIINSINGYWINNSGNTISTYGNENLLLTDISGGTRTLIDLIRSIASITRNSTISFYGNEFATIESSDSDYILKILNNSGNTVSVLTRDGNQGYNTQTPQEKIHINNGNLLLSGDTTGTTTITIETINFSGSSKIEIGGYGRIPIYSELTGSTSTATSFPTGYLNIGQPYINIIEPISGRYPHKITDFTVFLLSASGETRCEVYDGSGYTGTLLETKDITIPDNSGDYYTFSFDNPINVTNDQIITFKITRVGGSALGVGVTSGTTYPYPLIIDDVVSSSYLDFIVSGYTSSGGTKDEAIFQFDRIGENDIIYDSKYRGNSRVSTDGSLYIGGNEKIVFQTNGLVNDPTSPMTDVMLINQNGILQTNLSGYTSLVTDNSHIPNKGYVDMALSAMTSGMTSNRIESLSTYSFAEFGNGGVNEYLTISTYSGGTGSKRVAQFGDGSTHSKLIIDPDGILGNTTGIWFGDGDSGWYESTDDTITYVSPSGINFEWAGNRFSGYLNNAGGIFNEISSATNPTIVPARDDSDTGLGRAGSDQLSLIAGGVEGIRVNSTSAHSVTGITDYETLVVDDDDLPNKKYVDDISIKPYVTVGTGGQFTTIEDAVSAGHRFILLLSDITLTQNIAGFAADEHLQITAIDRNIILDVDAYTFGTKVTCDNLTATISSFVSNQRVVFKNCIIDSQVKYWATDVIFHDCVITLTNGLFGNVGCKAYNCEFELAANSYFNLGYYYDCTFKGTGTENCLNGSWFNCEFINIDAIYQVYNLENCIVDGNVRVLTLPNPRIIGNNITGFMTVNENAILKDNVVSLTFTIYGDNNKVEFNKITGATALSAGSDNNVIMGNTFTGGFTDNSGETTNQIIANVE